MIQYLTYPTEKMDRTKLKELLTTLKSLVSELESEIYSDTETYLSYDEIAKCTPIFDDDDGYPD